MDNNQMYHYGIMGMKWGVRRYQNPDGTLTAAGKRRAKKQEAKKIHPSEDYTKARTLKSKRPSELTNAELQELNKRLSLEKNYADLNRKKKKGKAAVDTFVNTAATVTALSIAAATYKKFGDKAISKLEGYVIKNVAQGLAKPLTN